MLPTSTYTPHANTSSTPPTLAHLQRKRVTSGSYASRNSMPFLKINWKEQNTLKKRNVWTVKVKAEAHLEPSWASTGNIYCKNGNQLSAIFAKKLQHKCSIEFYIRLSKDCKMKIRLEKSSRLLRCIMFYVFPCFGMELEVPWAYVQIK